jgi:probable phosphoglycerate mutase
VLESRSDAAGWQVYDDVLDDWVRWGRWERQIEQGESFLDMRARFVPFVERLVPQYRRRSDCLVLVGHGGLYRCMLPLVLVNVDIPFALAHPMGAAQAVVAEPGPDGLRCLEWCGQAV